MKEGRSTIAGMRLFGLVLRNSNLVHSAVEVSNSIQTRATDRPRLTTAGRFPSPRLSAPEDPGRSLFVA
jgi:hypothetical protein